MLGYLALGGVILLSLCRMIDLAYYRWRGTLTTGRVIKLHEEETSEGDGPVFVPIVEYRVDEKPWQIKSLIAMAPALYRVGQDVPVYYFAANPGDGRVVTGREFVKWSIPIAICLAILAMMQAK